MAVTRSQKAPPFTFANIKPYPKRPTSATKATKPSSKSTATISKSKKTAAEKEGEKVFIALVTLLMRIEPMGQRTINVLN
ncbi:hypothetical protein LTS10_010186 [Elasticomyces elasticus]|nr:hypothetical protein LTS10_010186 [Elasticomyces elasticus]